MKKPTFPTPEQIQEVIEKVNVQLSVKAINRSKNLCYKEGFTQCKELLSERIINPDNPYFEADTEEEWDRVNAIYKEQLKPIKKLKTQIGRTLAVICVDWLNGKIKQPTFLDIEIKTR